MVGSNKDRSLTDVPGIRVGHFTDLVAATGCTVVLCEEGAVAGVDVRGLAPGTRETDLLRPGSLVERVHAVVLAGGSAFGLDAASGVMRYLESRGVGFRAGAAIVPIVPAAVIFDLHLGRADVRPGAEDGWAACQAARAEAVQEGSVGAGTGASVGKALGHKLATKSGIGSWAVDLPDGGTVAALVVVNAFGDVVDPATGAIMAGARLPEGTGFADTTRLLREGRLQRAFRSGNTVIGVVATTAKLDGTQATAVARMAHDGLARAIRPAHTLFDGDALFALSVAGEGAPRGDVAVIGPMAAEVVAAAVVRSVAKATALAGLPAMGDLPFVGTGRQQ